MKPAMKTFALMALLIFFQSCGSGKTNTKTEAKLKDEKPFLSALTHIEANNLAEAKKAIDAEWIDMFLELIQNTQPGALKSGKWGFSRAKDNKLYLFIYNWQPGHMMQFPNPELPVVSAKSLNTDKAVKVEWAMGIEIFMDAEERDPIATVIEVTMDGDTEKMHPIDVSDWTDPTLNAKQKHIEDWQDQRFGLFVHWGPCSIEGREISWSRNGSQLGRIRYGGAGVNGEYRTDPRYDNLYKQFNPVDFDADEWVKIAKDAGMKYIVFVAKHPDSFCLFESEVTDYTMMSTPYGKDICKQLADACHKEGLKFGWYYSPRDWYHKDFGGDNHAVYMDFMMKQLEELLTNYGKIDILWFDGYDSPHYLWDDFAEESFRKIREWQPDIIINNRGGLRADFDTPEQQVGGFERNHPWESCVTVGKGWSWRNDNEAKPLDWCVKTLVNTASRNGNLLLNVGPQPNGEIASEQVKRLQEIGQWTSKYGKSIYGTRGGPFKPTGSVASTCKENKIFVHFIGEERSVKLPDFGHKIVKANLLNGGEVNYKMVEKGWEVSIESAPENEIDLIVELTIDGNAVDVVPLDFLNDK